MQSCDVAIIGGGVIGSAIAYFLAGRTDFKGSIAVVEKDPTYETAATPRSAGGVRQQFSTPENIQMSMFGAAFIKDAREHLTINGEVVELPFVEWGYLFLATAAGFETLRTNHTTQTSLGAKVALLTPSELKVRFPWLHVDDLAGGCYGLANEGWTDPYGLLQAFRRKARSLGVTYLADEVTGLERVGNRIASVTLRDGGRLACSAIVNAAGYHADKIAAMIGADLPVRPRKRIVYVFDCRDKPERAPLTIDPTGVWCRPEGATFIGGISPAGIGGSGLHGLRDRLQAVRRRGLADAGAAHTSLRGAQAGARLGRALRLQHARPECDIGATSGGRKLLLRQRIQRAWAAAVAGGRARHRRADRLWRIPQPGPAPLRL